MALKSLAEIAFDAFQTFSLSPRIVEMPAIMPGRSVKIKARWKQLSTQEQMVWERVAGRVQAEVVLRQQEEEQQNG